jgi:cyclin-dependent kinase 12/13
MWSFGCVLAELVVGHPIFSGRTEGEVLGKIVEYIGPPPTSLVE